MRSHRITIWIISVAILFIIIACGVVSAYVLRYQSLVDDEPDIVLSPAFSDITYCTMDDTPLSLDLYLPTSSDHVPYPLLVYIHGGSFTRGDKRKGSGIIDIPAMTERGYVVAAVNYRQMPQYPFPAALQDIKCAIRFLRAHAEQYKLRADKIGVWGGSAGGFYAAWVGLTGHDRSFDVGEYLEQSSEVDAVVEMFGPTDLTAKMGWLQQWLMRRAFGTSSAHDPLLRQVSPVFYPADGAPPFLILHGEQDGAVPVEQARSLYQYLQDAGVNATLVIVNNANHNFKPTGGEISPSRDEISSLLFDFFDSQIK